MSDALKASDETRALGEIVNGLRGDFSQIRLWDNLRKRIKEGARLKGGAREFEALCLFAWVVLRCKREGKR